MQPLRNKVAKVRRSGVEVKNEVHDLVDELRYEVRASNTATISMKGEMKSTKEELPKLAQWSEQMTQTIRRRPPSAPPSMV